MQSLIGIIGVLISVAAFGQVPQDDSKVTSIKLSHTSPFCSSVELESRAVSLRNMHEILNLSGAPVYRGGSPQTSADIHDLTDLGVEKVLVIKNFYNEKSKNQLRRLYTDNGYRGELVFLPLHWQADKKKGFDFVESCKLAMRALKHIKETRSPLFFHCTVGEDRTGFLSGLLRLHYDRWSVQEAFEREMCARGYEAGNPRKAKEEKVVRSIRENLTPLFLQVATLLSQGKNKESDCEQLPTRFVGDIRPQDLQCDPVMDSNRFCH